MFWPTAGDMDREPVDPVGEGVGRIPCELGVPGAGPPELSLLLPPLRSAASGACALGVVGGGGRLGNPCWCAPGPWCCCWC